MIKSVLLAATAAASIASPALAQQADNYTGFYVGGRVGTALDLDNNGERVLFDNNLDGNFGDVVYTAAGANAFSPGFCGGTAETALAADGCDKDKGGLDYAVHAGFDYDFGGPVVGVVAEYGRADIEDSVTAFSTTPANYVLTRELRRTMALRGRLGANMGGFLPYFTAGIVRAKIRSGQSTTNAANAFAINRANDNAFGFQLGGGIEKKFGAFAIGAQYLYTSVDDDDFRVNVTRGTAAATNPFVRVNASGTQFRRSDEQLDFHSVGVTGSFRF